VTRKGSQLRKNDEDDAFSARAVLTQKFWGGEHCPISPFITESILITKRKLALKWNYWHFKSFEYFSS